MTATDGIDAHVLHLRQLPVQGIRVECRTKAAKVMVQTHTIDLHVLAIEPEAGLGIETERTHTGNGLIAVHHLVAHKHFGHQTVDMRVSYRPQMGTAQRDHLPVFSLLQYRQPLMSLTFLATVCIEKRMSENDVMIDVAEIAQPVW